MSRMMTLLSASGSARWKAGRWVADRLVAAYQPVVGEHADDGGGEGLRSSSRRRSGCRLWAPGVEIGDAEALEQDHLAVPDDGQRLRRAWRSAIARSNSLLIEARRSSRLGAVSVACGWAHSGAARLTATQRSGGACERHGGFSPRAGRVPGGDTRVWIAAYPSTPHRAASGGNRMPHGPGRSCVPVLPRVAAEDPGVPGQNPPVASLIPECLDAGMGAGGACRSWSICTPSTPGAWSRT